MQLHLDRFEETDDATISRLYLPKDNGNPKIYYAVEDEYRKEKVAGETRIPAGIYEVKLRREGGMVTRYDARFANIEHNGMLWLQDVENFEFIYLHCGNSDDDSEGCIIVGMSRAPKMKVALSAHAYAEIYKAVYAHADSGNLSIEITDPKIRR